MVSVDATGHSGGLAFLWRNKDEVSLCSLNKNHIDVMVTMNSNTIFRLTGVYGEPDRSKRQETWSLLRNLASYNSAPWCLIGDMNNVLSQADKKGGRPYPAGLVQGFQDVVHDCELIDMHMEGYQFTWEKGLGINRHTEIRLDRALVTQTFLDLFKEAKLTNLEISTSDHSPLWLEP
ncbi:uncharacterized protein LOC141714363 [Apium graveolens]|uniref:uncharacterized protein LOC141714363 n=1 Tax=Apium graveolens TaxID=4045 RepID=UPI003D7B1788